MLVTFDQQNNGKTAVTFRQMHPSADRRIIVIGFGAVEYGAQTWDKFVYGLRLAHKNDTAGRGCCGITA